MAKTFSRRTNHEDFLAASLDKKSRYEGYLSEVDKRVLPVLERALREGWTREKLLSDPTISLLMAARQVTIAISEEDSGKALAAIKDATDRTAGKAVERVETTHKMASLPDEQLDSLLLSKLKDVSSEDEEEMPN